MTIKTITTVVPLVFVVFALIGCGDKQTTKEIKTYKYTTVQVYEKTCIKCHGKSGEGNLAKNIPALNDRISSEMAEDLYDIKNGGTSAQSSGTNHEIMEHNMQKLIEKGYDYDINFMAEFLSHLAKNK